MNKINRIIPLLLFFGLAFWSCDEQEPEQSDAQEEGPISIELPDCPSLENINEENLCIADDGTEGVKILDQCYSIENTTEINGPFSDIPSGNIPKEIGLLSNLIRFNCYNRWGNTKFTGEIPPEVCNLTNLIKFSVAYNEITGSIPPEIGHLTKLEYLHIFNNEISGEIPNTIGNLVELRSLGLGFNNLSGPIPQEIGNLNKVHLMSMHYNQLTGPIPSTIGNMQNLGVWHPEYYNPNFDTDFLPALDFSHNQLTGPLPASIGDLDDLEYVDLSYNQIDGPIPPEMGDMEVLVYMNLLNNQLNGEIPPELGNLSSLGLLWLGYNNLRGPIPEELCNVDVCYSDVVCNSSANIFRTNNLCPPWPDCFENFLTSEGIIFDRTMQHTQVCNNYPECEEGYTAVANPPPLNNGKIYDGLCLYQGDIDILQDFVDANDSLTGNPLVIGTQYWSESVNGNYRLRVLQLNDLHITEIPETIVNLNELESIDFSNTQISTIPESIGELSELRSLICRGGQLAGSIPTELGNLTNLRQVIIEDTQLTGTIPAGFGNTNLMYLWLNNNQLTGEVPLEIWNINAMYESGDPADLRLYFQHNQLTGVIPESICDLDLRWDHYSYVDIRDNKFCPPYPSCLEEYVGEQDTSNCD